MKASSVGRPVGAFRPEPGVVAVLQLHLAMPALAIGTATGTVNTLQDKLGSVQHHTVATADYRTLVPRLR